MSSSTGSQPAPTLAQERRQRDDYSPMTYDEVIAAVASFDHVHFQVYDAAGNPSDPPRGVWMSHRDDSGFRELLVATDQEGRRKLKLTRGAFVQAEGDEDGVLIEHEDGSTVAIRRDRVEDALGQARERMESALPTIAATLQKRIEAGGHVPRDTRAAAARAGFPLPEGQ